MLSEILKKLGFNTMDEFWENERRIMEEYKGMGIERRSPLMKLSDEELDFLQDNGYIMG